MEPALQAGRLTCDGMPTKREGEARDKAVRAFIQRRVRELTAPGGQTLEVLGEKLGLSHVTVSNIRQGLKCGPRAQRAFANAYFGGSMDALVAAATGRGTMAPLDQYPDADIAAEVARREGIPEEAIRQALQETDRSGASDWTLQDWVEEIRAKARRLRRGGPHIDEIDVEDDVPPGRGAR